MNLLAVKRMPHVKIAIEAMDAVHNTMNVIHRTNAISIL